LNPWTPIEISRWFATSRQLPAAAASRDLPVAAETPLYELVGTLPHLPPPQKKLVLEVN
jgi:hypothetical protein